MKESEGTEEMTTFPLYTYLLRGQEALPNCKPISVGRPGDKSYRTPLPHPTTPNVMAQTIYNAHYGENGLYPLCEQQMPR